MAGHTRSIHPDTMRRMRSLVFGRDDYTCRACGWRPPDADQGITSIMVARKNGRSGYRGLELDHIKPYSKGGLFTEDNLQTLCNSCNAGKGARG